MNIVDSSGWLEYFANGPNAEFFAPAIEDTAERLVPSISLHEVFNRVLQQRGENEALNVVAAMCQGRILDLTAPVALTAARISAREKIPMADSVVLASAQMSGALLWTQDADLEGFPEVRYVRSAP
jgi:predicted nucleic acid-binding protein